MYVKLVLGGQNTEPIISHIVEYIGKKRQYASDINLKTEDHGNPVYSLKMNVKSLDVQYVHSSMSEYNTTWFACPLRFRLCLLN